MHIKKPSKFQKYLASICIATALMGTCTTAWSVENTEQIAEETTLQKIQGFTNRATELVIQAVSVIGVHYKFGGNSPETGIDCSGLVQYVFKEAWGAVLPRTSAEISKVGKQVSEAQLQPGDLVFYNTRKRKFSHVGIYLGDNQFIHAPSSGGQVRVESMETSYWRKRFNGARRIAKPESIEPDEILEIFNKGM